MIKKINTLIFQKTIDKKITVSGIGLHTGCSTRLIINPAPSNHGIKFKRTDLNGRPIIDAIIENVIDTNRGTTLGDKNVEIHTVEHILAAISGLNIDNLLIEINNIEVPILDGSAIDYVNLLVDSGIKKLDSYKQEIIVDKTIKYTDSKLGIDIHIVPSDRFRITFMMDYKHPSLGTQFASYYSNEKEFIENIAPARTFCLLSEVAKLLDGGLIRGGSLENSLVFKDVELSDSDKNKIYKELDIKFDESFSSELLNQTELRYNDVIYFFIISSFY